MQGGKQKTTRTNKFNDPSGGKFYENIKKGGFEGQGLIRVRVDVCCVGYRTCEESMLTGRGYWSWNTMTFKTW